MNEPTEDDLCLLAVVALAPLNGRCPADPRMRGYGAYRRLVDAGLGYFEDGEFVAGEKPVEREPEMYRQDIEEWSGSDGVRIIKRVSDGAILETIYPKTCTESVSMDVPEWVKSDERFQLAKAIFNSNPEIQRLCPSWKPLFT